VVDEVEVVPWCDGHGSGSPLGEGDIGLVQGLVDVDEPIDDGLAVGGGLGKVRVHHWEVVWNHVLHNIEDVQISMSNVQQYVHFT
jgi:hypothetical protein